jgi:spore maturation protein CgeB
MDDFGKLSRLMKDDWNRRVNHDYRFWMSDGLKTDEAMWQAGERDFAIITEGINQTEQLHILEVGCGVGRLLRPAVARFGKVTGIDVSEQAIKMAQQFLGNHQNLELMVGNGFDLKPIADSSVDVVFSFAALTSMPTDVIAHYLIEMHRVLRPGGQVRLQVYCGEEYRVCREDTLHVRCYSERNLRAGIQSAGFELINLQELKLPLQVSFEDIGIKAVMITLVKTNSLPGSIGEVSNSLLPGGEVEVSVVTNPHDLEHWTALNYAQKLVQEGDIERAKQALEYAVTHCQNTTIDTKDLLERIKTAIDAAQGTIATPRAFAQPPAPQSWFNQNMAVVRRKFPLAYEQIQQAALTQEPLELRDSAQGPVFWLGGQCLDHPSKPVGSADAWVKRELSEKQDKSCNHILVGGFGAGYHIERIQQTKWAVSVYEPYPMIMRRALELRDLRGCLEGLRHLVVGSSDYQVCLDENTELTIRPQYQAVEPAIWTGIRSVFFGTRGLLALSPKIAILGPIQGGTLPMVPNCIRALYDLRQRPREIDMSGFASGFHLAEKFVTGKPRQQSLQGVYIEMMSQFVLESVLEKPIDILICMAQAPASGRILTELRKRGVITVLWFVEDYVRFGYWKDIAQYYDFVFTIQKGECLEKIRAAGAGEVHYIPTACDPYLHRPMVLSAEERKQWGSPVSFVGAGYHNRQQVFASMADFPLKLWGTEWPTCKPFDRMVQEQGRRITPEEYVKIFNATDVNINLHSSTERDGVDPFGDFVNPRTFELAASGAFQLVDERSLLGECFEPGKEVITFSNPRDLKDKIRYYLERPEERARIAEAARIRALKEHSYAHRLKDMLSIIYSSRFESLKRREDSSPWKKMLERSKIDPELSQRCELAFRRGEEPILDGLVSDIVTGKGKLSETEQKLLFLFHIRKQIIRMKSEEMGQKVG